MRVPLSWLRELVALPISLSAREIADALLRQGLEVEGVELFGSDLEGELVVARVLTVEVLTEGTDGFVVVDAVQFVPRK